MMSFVKRSLRFAAVASMAFTCLAQNADTVKYYKLDFVVKEVEAAKVLNTRAYSMTVSTDKAGAPSSMRTGSKVPAPGAPGGSQLQFFETGVNIDCRSVKDVDNELTMILTAEVSSAVMEPSAAYPVIRQNRWGSVVVVPLRKPTVVFSSDDTSTKRQMLLELTATPLK